MSATAAPVTLDVTSTERTPFSRLVKVEVRKMLDTRSGFWLLLISGILLFLVAGVLILIASLTDSDLELTAQNLSQIFVIPVSLLVPVFGVLVVTSEWSQRTAMVTFALEPHRLRVVLAKLVAVSILAIGTIALAAVVGSLSNVVLASIDGQTAVWDLALIDLFWMVVVQLAFFGMGFALGTLVLSTPAAVAIYYVVALMLPLILWPILFAVFGWAQDVLPWVEINTAATPIMSGRDLVGNEVTVDVTNYLQLLTSIGLWVALPLVVGIGRLLRAELK